MATPSISLPAFFNVTHIALFFIVTGAVVGEIIKDDLIEDHLIVVPPNEEEDTPKFVPPVSNTTVNVGDNALLACVVDNLQSYKVAWVKVSTQTILTVHQSVITKDGRISLSYNDHRSWYLHIKSVKPEDRGWYMCQINTGPITSQSVYLQVLVPPSIVDQDVSTDIVIKELSDVLLRCKSQGYPEPYVMWRRGDGNDFNYNGDKVNVVDGEELRIYRVSRLHMGVYYCVARNGIAPTASKKFTLTVHFPPILHIPNQLVGAATGHKVTLLCITEAYPKSINYWLRGTGEMLTTGELYETEYRNDVYTTNMMLTIKTVSETDYGTFICTSINPLGSIEGNIKLYQVAAPASTDEPDGGVTQWSNVTKFTHIEHKKTVGNADVNTDKAASMVVSYAIFALILIWLWKLVFTTSVIG